MEKNLYVRRSKSRLIAGALLILAGILFVGINIGLIPRDIGKVIFSFPMLLIIIGLICLLKKYVFTGLILSFTGLFFLIPRVTLQIYGEIYRAPENFTTIFWPLLLILYGIALIIHWIAKPSGSYEFYRHWEKKKKGAFSRSTVFGIGEHIILDEEFKGGKVNAVFGDTTIDLRKTYLPEGETRLEVSAVFGRIVVLVPETWRVESLLDSVFGGFQDNRIFGENIDESRKLIIEGECVFGGGELKN